MRLYIIHGWTYTVAPWERTIALLKKQGIDVKMVNVPGLTSPSKKVWTIEEYVKFADREIPDGAVALGHSNGGRILLNLCSEKPDKLKQLILLDSAGIYEPSKKRDVSRGLSKTFGFLKKIPGLAKIWHKLTGAADYARAPENMKQTLANMLESDKRLDPSQVSVPTTILWGAEDSVTPPRQAEALHSAIANSTLEIFPGWTHAPYISHPDQLARAIARSCKHPPVVAPASPDVTHTASVSASMALKKAAEPIVPDTTKVSASMNLKKAAGPVPNVVKNPVDNTLRGGQKRAVDGLSNPKPPSGLSHVDIPGVDYEKAEVETRKVITTASVPKVSRITRVKRQLKPSARSSRRRKTSSQKRSKQS